MKKWHVHGVLFLLTGVVLLLLPFPNTVKDILYKTYNLILFLYIVCGLAAPKVRTFFIERKERIGKEIAEANREKERAEKLLESYQEKIDSLERERVEILERCRNEGKREKEQIIREAEEEAQRIMDQARRLVFQEIKKLREELKEETIYASIRMAEELIRENYSQEDQKRAIEATLNRLKDVSL